MSVVSQNEVVCVFVGRETPRADFEIIEVLVETEDTVIKSRLREHQRYFSDVRFEERYINLGVNTKTGSLTWGTNWK